MIDEFSVKQGGCSVTLPGENAVSASLCRSMGVWVLSQLLGKHYVDQHLVAHISAQ